MKARPLVVLISCLVLFVVNAVTSMVQEASTWDETCYIGLGKYLLQHGRWDASGSILHPPLSYYIHSLPLLFISTDPRPWRHDPALSKDLSYRGASDIVRGQAVLSDPANEGNHLLNWARLMMVLTGVLLGCYVYRWSYALYGEGSAMLAIFLFSFSPNILAHARLITPDITVTTFFFITLYYFWRLLKEGRARDAWVGGVCFGLALMSKFTSLLLFPIGASLVLLWWIGTRSQTNSKDKDPAAVTSNSRRRLILKVLIFAGVGIFIFCLGYRMNLEPFMAGLQIQRERADIHYTRFLLGHYSNTEWWYYLLVAFLIKTPLATLIFLGLAAWLLVQRLDFQKWTRVKTMNLERTSASSPSPPLEERAGERRPSSSILLPLPAGEGRGEGESFANSRRFMDGCSWFGDIFLLWPAAVIFGFFSLSPHALGLRYILPIYPFLFVFASQAAQVFSSGRWMMRLQCAMLVWYAGASCFIYPHYLAYFNELVGGPKNGYKCLVDSNMDWGQDLKGLKKFMDAHGIDSIYLSYFGSDSPERYGIVYRWLPGTFSWTQGPGNYKQPKKGWVAVSATNLQGVYFDDKGTFDWLKSRKPVATIGYSILIYHLDE